jgi:hypothetical protein
MGYGRLKQKISRPHLKPDPVVKNEPRSMLQPSLRAAKEFTPSKSSSGMIIAAISALRNKMSVNS